MAPLRSARETTQPNRTDTEYWATGLTPVFLEGSLERTLDPLVMTPPPPIERPAFDGPLPQDPSPAGHSEAVLNPFSVYRKGEELLRSQLGALAGWHLVNIIEAYDLSEQTPDELNRLTPAELTELIISPPPMKGGISRRCWRRAHRPPVPVGPSILWPVKA